jgi:hypothetical protein
MPDKTELHDVTAAFLSKPDFELCQYLHVLHHRDFAEPERQLLLVLLEDALRCLEKYALTRNGKGKILFHETEDWVFATAEDWVFSFNNVCEALGFNPEYIRKGVMQWKTRNLAPPTNNYHEQIQMLETKQEEAEENLSKSSI